MNSEEDLIRACAGGDPAAWGEFVGRTTEWLTRVIRATLNRQAGRVSDADADDVLAEVHRQLLERDRALLRTFRAPFNLKAWLAVIARRACLRLLRRKPTAPIPENLPAPSPESMAIQDLLEQLSPEDRLLLELFFVHESSYEEIARSLGIAVDSVGKRKFRAVQRLRELARERGLELRPG